MLSIGNTLTAAIESYHLTAVSFLEIGLSPRQYLTEAPIDVDFSGTIYRSNSDLIGISLPQAYNSVDRDTYQIRFSDNGNTWRDRFQGRSGITLNVKMGFANDDGDLVTELLDVYQGFSSKVDFRYENEGFVTEVAFTGQLQKLDQTNIWLCSPQNQAQRDTTDRAFQFVQDSVSDARGLPWGRGS